MQHKKDVISDKTTEKNRQTFFADRVFCQGTTHPLGQDPEWLCVVSQHGRIQVKPSGERLAESKKKSSGPPDGYEFDR